jgi:hypothetical protein
MELSQQRRRACQLQYQPPKLTAVTWMFLGKGEQVGERFHQRKQLLRQLSTHVSHLAVNLLPLFSPRLLD